MEAVEGFDWDAGNVGPILRHAVAPNEVEEAVGRTHAIIQAKPMQGEERWKLFGTTAAGRYLVVIFTIRRSCSAPLPHIP